MGNDDITVEILKSIRDELREVRDETRANGVKLDQVRTELGSRLDRVVQEQIRHSTAIVALEARVGDLAEGQRAVVGELVKLNTRVDNV